MKKFLFFLLLAILMTPAYIAYTNPIPIYLRVGLTSDFSGRSSIELNNTTIFYGQYFLQSLGGFTVRPYGSHQVSLYDGSHRVRVFYDFTQIRDAHGDMLWLDGRPYRGAIEFARLSGSGITAINVISIEEYLFSVVPSEMPASWNSEALKAQAVASRTYALRGSIHNGFDICDSVHCQVYRGAEWEHEVSTQAVLATMGLALYFDGELIEAVYFASSGGLTENSENVWLEARPYLRSVADIYEFEPVIWTRYFTLSELTNLLIQNNHSVGVSTGMSIGGFHPSGRVESLIIQGTEGDVVLTREEIRTFFSPSAYGALKSRNFTLGGGQVNLPERVAIFCGQQIFNMEAFGLYGITDQGIPKAMESFSATSGLAAVVYGKPQQQITTQGDLIAISGRGFGHGVGMSQRGAEGMAQQGYTFREILEHFYTGAVVDNIFNSQH